MHIHYTYKSVICALLISLFPVLSEAQLSLNAENMALGGGGTAYLTGYESLFVNPANLFISEKTYRLEISAFQGSFYIDTMLPVDNNSKLDQYRTITSEFRSSEIPGALSQNRREFLLDRNYPNNRMISQNKSIGELYWFGIKWTRSDRNYALALRTRIGNRHEISRGQFSDEIFSIDDSSVFDQSFRHQYQILHEISFGYAESFTLLNGLIPQLSEFIVGIAPKIVISGANLDVNHTNSFNRSENSSVWTHENSTSQQTSGPFSNNARNFFDSSNGGQVSDNQSQMSELLNPTGIGFGLDLGVTYLITFGDDLSILREQDAPTEKSLRLSFSITDIGAVRYFEDPITYDTNTTIRESATLDPVSNYPFTGSPGEHYFFLNQNNTFIQSPRYIRNSNSYTTLLPASVQAGALFQISRFKLMGDLSLAFHDSAFQKNGLTSYFGAEVRPFSFLPLRAGTRFAPGLPGYYSFGTGIETKSFDLNAAVQLKTDNFAATSEIVGASVLGLKFYFQ